MSTKRIAIDLELAQAAEVQAKRLGIKPHQVIENAIRSSFSEGESLLAATKRPDSEGPSVRASKSSHPHQTLSIPIANNSEKSTETWCKYASSGQHKMVHVDTDAGYSRCDLCYYQPGSRVGDCLGGLQHVFAEIHGWGITDNDVRCIDLCARCELKETRWDCESWAWCVTPERWEQILEQRKHETRRSTEGNIPTGDAMTHHHVSHDGACIRKDCADGVNA